ncbi:MAG: GNAT family N-acetyltransferase [Pseudomonadota bacterium]
MTTMIRPLKATDRERWVELWQSYLTFYDATVSAEVTQKTWERLLTLGVGHDGLVAVDDAGSVIGITHYLLHASTWSIDGYCYLEDLFVDPDARGKGAATALINAVDEAARAAGCTRLYLMTQTDNTRAQRVYDQLMTKAPFVQYRKALA